MRNKPEPRSGNDRQGGPKRTSGRDGDKKPYAKRDGAARGPKRSFGSDEDKPRRSYGSGDAEKRPYQKREGADGEKRPYQKREGASGDRKRPFGGDDKPHRSFDKSDGEKRPYQKRDGADGEKRPYQKREGADGEKRPYQKREGAAGDRKRPFDRDDKPRRSFDKGDSEKRPYQKRDGADGEKRPYQKREGATGDRKRPFDRDDKPKRSYDKGDGEKRPYQKREGATGDRKRSFDRDDKPKRGADKEDKTPKTFDDVKNQAFAREPKKPVGDIPPVDPELANKKYAELEEDDKTGRKKKKYDILKNALQKPKKGEANIEESEPMTLNKYIAHSGQCGRREAAELVKLGKVKVNGELVVTPGYRVKDTDKVTIAGKKLTPQRNLVYVLLNKPKGFITTTEDPEGRHTVMELVDNTGAGRLYPVGRLDRNTSGLLLLTNDGDLAQKLAHPSYGIKKVYQITLDKPLTKAHFDQAVAGVTLDDGIAHIDALSYLDSKNELGLEIHSGRNRIVRRIFETLGYEVEKLDRVMYAGLTKKNLPRGKWRFLAEKEVILLKHFKV